MKRFSPRTMWLAITVMAIISASFFVIKDRSVDQEKSTKTGKQNLARTFPTRQSADAGQPDVNTDNRQAPTAMDKADLRQALTKEVIASKLNELFGSSIHDPGLQLQAIEKLLAYLRQIHPQNWADYVSEYLSAAFPEQADALYAQYLRLQGFKQWLQDNYAALIGMPANERNDYLWAKRKQFFGEDAGRIWARELEGRQVAAAIEEINQLQQAPFQDKVDYYNARLRDIYADRTEAYKSKNSQKLMDQFLSAETVQEDLQAMRADQRRESLQLFRKSVGLDEPAVQRWTDLDAARDERWESGGRYMQQRANIVSEFSGAERDAKLDALRKEVFGSQAGTIKDEEETGLFRFARQRVYGKN